MTRLHLGPMTPKEAAQFLRNACEVTAANSRNWDNMQDILEQFVTDAYKGGFRKGQERMRERAAISVTSQKAWADKYDCANAISALPIVEPDADK